jgi:hypothetical protein
VDEDGDERRVKAKEEEGGGLMGRLKGVLGNVEVGQGKQAGAAGSGGEDEYQKFLDGLGDMA